MSIFKNCVMLALFSGLLISSAVLGEDHHGDMKMSKDMDMHMNMPGMTNKADKSKSSAKKAAGKVQKYNTPEAKKGETVICPVQGTVFKVTDKSLFVTVKGKKYYVCCNMCPDELKNNPDKYLK